MAEQDPAYQYRPPAPLNVLHLESGTHVRLIGDATAEVVSNPKDGVWILLRYLSAPQDQARVGTEEMVFAEDVLEVL